MVHAKDARQLQRPHLQVKYFGKSSFLPAMLHNNKQQQKFLSRGKREKVFPPLPSTTIAFSNHLVLKKGYACNYISLGSEISDPKLHLASQMLI